MKAAVLLSLLFCLPLGAHPDARHTLEELEEHLAIAPADQTLLRRKAELLLSNGEPQAAGPVIAKLLALETDAPENLLLEARVLLALGDQDQALAKANTLVASYPAYSRAWALLSHILEKSGNRDGAITAQRRFLDLAAKPGATEVMTCAAWLRERAGKGDAEAAVEVLDDGLEKIGCLSGLHLMAIEIERGLGRFDHSLKRIDLLAARFRPTVDLALLRATILESSGRPAEAATACDSALAILDARPQPAKASRAWQEQFDAVTKRKQANLESAAGR